MDATIGRYAQHDSCLTNRSWDPECYLQFSGLRLRPAVELLQRVPLASPHVVYDLGCGTGQGTVALGERWPRARVAGVDSSPEMLDRARTLEHDIAWREADIRNWTPDEPADLIVASAVLHFLGDHDILMPQLMRHLRPGGCLALHMPDWWGTPWYRLMHEVLATGGADGGALGTPALRAELAKNRVESPQFYYSLLAPRAAHLDIWHTDYLQIVEGENPVFDWIKVSGLRIVTDALAADERGRFLDLYVPRLHALYPRRDDGRTLFPFKRLFIVAQAPSC